MPVINGKIHHFRPYGLLNGLVILIDQETHSLWDHITGKAIDGSLKGYQLEVWPIRFITVVSALREYPDIEISMSTYRSIRKWFAATLYPKFIHARVLLPFFFRWTMQSKPDPRLPELTQGLGVVVDGRAKYYPLSVIPSDGLQDRWLNRTLRVQRSQMDNVPQAFWNDTNEQPMQLLTRWYGFAFTYHDCEIYTSSYS
jgi:uncharacterized protein DUF3179